MPHPKRRQSKSRKGLRRAHDALTPPTIDHCSRCGSAVRPHTVCDNCGYYGFKKGSEKGGREVFEKDEF